MTYQLPINSPVAAHLKFADVMPGDYGASVKLKATIDGDVQHVYCPGSAADMLTQLRAAGVIAEIPRRLPGNGDAPVALTLAARNVMLELVKDAPRGPRRLVVTVRESEAPAPPPAPRSPASAPAVRTAPANPGSSTPGPAAADVIPDDARARCEARRAAITRAFRDAMETAGAELLPIFARHDIAVDGDTFFKIGFSLFTAWRESGAR